MRTAQAWHTLQAHCGICMSRPTDMQSLVDKPIRWTGAAHGGTRLYIQGLKLTNCGVASEMIKFTAHECRLLHLFWSQPAPLKSYFLREQALGGCMCATLWRFAAIIDVKSAETLGKACASLVVYACCTYCSGALKMSATDGLS